MWIQWFYHIPNDLQWKIVRWKGIGPIIQKWVDHDLEKEL
jgi:hypothetical protein